MEAVLSFNDLKKNLKKNVSTFTKIKIGLCGDSTTSFLSMAIKGMGVERKYNMELLETEYNQLERQLLFTDSELHAFNADVIIVFQATHKLLQQYNCLSPDKQALLADERLEFIRSISHSCTSKLIYFNYPEIDDTVFGNYANKIEHSFVLQVRKLNYELMKLAQQTPNLYICDVSSIQNMVGRSSLYNSSLYISADMVFSLDILPQIAASVLDIIDAVCGKFKKCVILDLDNTLWGGVIGDDGLENIELGQGLGIGKAFTEFQRWIKQLKNRGIILAVCSKNDEVTAKEPFEKHPEMVLSLDDIAVFIANWDNKVNNIYKIQSILNISFDSMVFIDDNAVERNMVRENIPEITVPELPDDPAEYLEYLYSLHLFETSSYSSEDMKRTKQYQIESQRILLQKKFNNEVDFLKELDMTSEVSIFNPYNIPRVAQLSQRSNQFNLRTVRFTEDEINALSKNEHYQNFCFNLTDKYGDYGLIAVIILEKQNSDTLFIHSWFMSCRVLQRGMENFALNILVQYARQHHYTKIMGEYIPTAKNKLVEHHYQQLGFTAIKDETRKQYMLDVNTYSERECYIKEIKNY